jgi:DNA ligase-1
VRKHLAGSGRHKGRLGALLVELPDGTTFSVGTGFSDAERKAPPPVGSQITFRYQELSDGGVPRFPSFVGVRADAPSPASPVPQPGGIAMSSATTTGTRRFEFTEGSSSKFWEVSARGAEVTVRFGRLGTQGQTQVKAFPVEAAAAHHVAKLIGEKTGKGYREVR